MERAPPESQPKPAPGDLPAFRASPYGHRWSEFDPSLGKTVWRRDSLKKKRRRSVHGTESDAAAEAEEITARSVPSPPRSPPRAVEVTQHARNPKMDIAFLLNRHPHEPPGPRPGGAAPI